ncbi:hypothetical protein P170DRAFT_352188 [Aspergillus steynii IBT 23096]|uniref:Tat pathway signal sequence n=1 Tax=Aspergillus steynii IBT 23096 TaxID=1392250 RepID=A0A2I2GFA9_9EURO|nr:uncharacterized protein P170DRAFT_352188 [Aspergillus steynii IBT 23096]PLB51573.1 hypothetical protein P170DRAFT_352188 [Aspergillus steynii IBT 23096]
MEQKEDPASLGTEEEQSTSSESSRNPFLKRFQARNKHSWEMLTPWLIHGSIIIAYSLLLWAVLFPGIPFSASDKDERKTNSASPSVLPAREGLQWEYRRFPTKIVDNPFAGPPRPEMDDAWHDLLKNDNIRVPAAYLREKNLTSIYTEDYTEGIASLSVYHSLHCLKKIKHMIYREYYHADLDETAMARESKHVDHCIEYIRESLMCQPDLSLVTFRWINNTAQYDDPAQFYPTNFDRDLHCCVDWERLDRWAGERAFDLFRVDLLDRPGQTGEG